MPRLALVHQRQRAPAAEHLGAGLSIALGWTIGGPNPVEERPRPDVVGEAAIEQVEVPARGILVGEDLLGRVEPIGAPPVLEPGVVHPVALERWQLWNVRRQV